MTDAIIGGAIAAVVGAVCYAIVGLLLERRRRKVQQLTIVDALIIETEENITTCKGVQKFNTPWWLTSYKLEAYHAYKGQPFFLSKEVQGWLVACAFVMHNYNVAAQIFQARAGFGQPIDFEFSSKEPQQKLLEQLESLAEELHRWRKEHTR